MRKIREKKRVVIFGATGMLGSGVYAILKDKYNLVLTVRDKRKVALLEKAYGGTKKHQIIEFDAGKVYQGDFFRKKLEEIGPVDDAINGIGLVIAPVRENPPLAFLINSAFPHLLAEKYGEKLIHVSTDCVFNGKEGFPYNEHSPKTPVDVYGLSKSLGESANCLTLRTSLIGRELEGFSGLLEWFLHRRERTIKGFANHFWDGITTKQFGKICDQIFSDRSRFPSKGLYHIFSEPISKYEMLIKFREKYHLDCEIKKDVTTNVNRVLTTKYQLNSQLKIPSFGEMLADLD